MASATQNQQAVETPASIENQKRWRDLNARLHRDGYADILSSLPSHRELRIGLHPVLKLPIFHFGTLGSRRVYVVSSYGTITHLSTGDTAGQVYLPVEGDPFSIEIRPPFSSLKDHGMGASLLKEELLAMVRYYFLSWAPVSAMRNALGVMQTPDYSFLLNALNILAEAQRLPIPPSKEDQLTKSNICTERDDVPSCIPPNDPTSDRVRGLSNANALAHIRDVHHDTTTKKTNDTATEQSSTASSIVKAIEVSSPGPVEAINGDFQKLAEPKHPPSATKKQEVIVHDKRPEAPEERNANDATETVLPDPGPPETATKESSSENAGSASTGAKIGVNEGTKTIPGRQQGDSAVSSEITTKISLPKTDTALQTLRSQIGMDRLSVLPDLSTLKFDEVRDLPDYLPLILRIGTLHDAPETIEVWAFLKPGEGGSSIEFTAYDEQQREVDWFELPDLAVWSYFLAAIMLEQPFASMQDEEQFTALVKYYFLLAAEKRLFGFGDAGHKIGVDWTLRDGLIDACESVGGESEIKKMKKSRVHTRGIAKVVKISTKRSYDKVPTKRSHDKIPPSSGSDGEGETPSRAPDRRRQTAGHATKKPRSSVSDGTGASSKQGSGMNKNPRSSLSKPDAATSTPMSSAGRGKNRSPQKQRQIIKPIPLKGYSDSDTETDSIPPKAPPQPTVPPKAPEPVRDLLTPVPAVLSNPPTEKELQALDLRSHQLDDHIASLSQDIAVYAGKVKQAKKMILKQRGLDKQMAEYWEDSIKEYEGRIETTRERVMVAMEEKRELDGRIRKVLEEWPGLADKIVLSKV
ncbi:hypothetical protein BU26DRAFT_327383 [Trematosphaeria pertusa]|uniref:Uncharacterized protein n=1 Tax=Trematosphaeria pertusa TaxID=390896 RepID=A0A6A6IC24_9PLEO|nr:uncharacterized protein BU26DRAFT_327383 [Trematosphaeria pertusa]KAF2248125.1 hypothetical protein BU26DRAFT_327383 [Trematosphaeria pertusa]